MTISSSANRSGPYLGNGLASVFPRKFFVLDEDHVAVYLTSSGITSEVVSGIVKDGIGSATGNVTFDVPPASGDMITLIRRVPLTQETDYSEQGKVPPVQVEYDLDFQEMQIQDMSERIDRSYAAPVTGKSFSAGNVPMFDADGNLVDSGTEAIDLSHIAALASQTEINAAMVASIANSNIMRGIFHFDGTGDASSITLPMAPASKAQLTVLVGGTTLPHNCFALTGDQITPVVPIIWPAGAENIQVSFDGITDIVSIGSVLTYPSRAALVVAIADGLVIVNGQTVIAGGLAYKGQTGATMLPGLPGLVPAGEWTFEHFGDTGTANDGAVLSAAMAAIDGRKINGYPARTYLFNPITHPQVWDNEFRLVSNGCKFRCTVAANAGYAITINAPARGDVLTLETVGAANAQFAERGIDMPAGGFWDLVEAIAVNDQTGANNLNYNAVRVGPASGSRVAAWIGRINCKNWDRAIVLRRLKDFVIGRIDCETYRRAVYISDCQEGYINGGHVFGMSPTSTGKAGENGVLIDASADFATKNIRINNFTVEDSGEHGFRIGGQKIISGVWHNLCEAINFGLGYGVAPGPDDDDHGGCGFKVLGPTLTNGARHQNIHYDSCTAYAGVLQSVVDRPNFAGFQIGKVYGGSVRNCGVYPGIPDAAYTGPTVNSCHTGIEVLGCENLDLADNTIIFPRRSGIEIYDAQNAGGIDWGPTQNVKITGGSVVNPGYAAVEVSALFTTLRRITVSDMLCDGGLYALAVNKSGSGALNGCTFGATVWNNTTANLLNADDFVCTLAGQFTGANACRKGSTFQDWGSGVLKTYGAMGWETTSGTFTVTIAKDTAISFVPRVSDGVYTFSSQSSGHNGQAWLRTSSSAASVKYSSGANFAVMNSVLDGTTGTAGNLTIGAQPGLIYIENKTAGPQTIRVTQ